MSEVSSARLAREVTMSGHPVLWENPAFASLMNQMTVAVIRANSTPRALWEKLPKETETKIRFYSFYSLDTDNRIAVGVDRECESDAMAIAYGHEMLAFEDYQKIEVWLRDARVGLVHKNGAHGHIRITAAKAEVASVLHEQRDFPTLFKGEY